MLFHQLLQIIFVLTRIITVICACFVVDTFPLAQALPMIFRGTGDCSVVLWKFAGLSIAEWALVCFITILIIEIWHLTKWGRIEIS